VRARVGDRWIGLVVAGALALASTAACSIGDEQGNDDAASGEPVAVEQQVRVPSDEAIGDGCGEASATESADLAADRTVARCAPGFPEPQPLPSQVTLRVGIEDRGEDLAPVLLADRLDELAAENLDVEIVEESDPAKLWQALGRGEIDVMVGDLDAPFFDQVSDGTGVRLVLGGALARRANDVATPQPGLWIRGDKMSASDSYHDLEGSGFAIPDGIDDAAAASMTAVLRQDDLSLNEVRIDLTGGADAAALLRDGKVTGAWLDDTAWPSVQGDHRFRLVATLPASESLGGVVLAPRLVDHDRDRAVGLAFVRAIIRTVNTYLADDYQADDEVVAALAEATGLSADELRATPPWLFDWEVRSGTTDRIQDTFVQLGSVLYEESLPQRDIADLTLYRDVVAPELAPAAQDQA